ncbi:hypothetical protein [Acinetobacter bohemicus]|nr:hypothetical protein [Acinetobacter bohemicus]
MAIPAGISQTVNLALAIGLISSMPDTDSGSKSVSKDEQCERDSCPPCVPYPVGSLGYIGPKISQIGTDAGNPHYKIFQVLQNPKTCSCIWQQRNQIAGHHYSYQPNVSMAINLNHKYPIDMIGKNTMRYP